jgi:hypothetical protein
MTIKYSYVGQVLANLNGCRKSLAAAIIGGLHEINGICLAAMD